MLACRFNVNACTFQRTEHRSLRYLELRSHFARAQSALVQLHDAIGSVLAEATLGCSPDQTRLWRKRVRVKGVGLC